MNRNALWLSWWWWWWWWKGGASYMTVGVFAFLEGSLIGEVFLPLMARPWFVLLVLVSQGLAALMLAAWFIVTLSDPGFLPLPSPGAAKEEADVEGGKEEEEEEEEEGSIREGRISLSEFMRTEEQECTFCLAYKPPQAHHCSLCQRCVLKMDHHCIFLNNCIGYRNAKAFFLLIIYTFLWSLIGLGCFVAHAAELFDRDKGGKDFGELDWHAALVATCICLLTLIILATAGLWMRHALGLIRNQTVLELMTNQLPEQNPGLIANLRQMFGTNPWMWPLPSLASKPPPS